MGIFNRYKGLNEYKILEEINLKRTPVDVDGVSGSECKVLYEDENVQIIVCTKERFDNESHYLLRREKRNKGKLFYLGNMIKPFCYGNGKVFWAFPYAISRNNHRITMIDCNTGERQDVDFLGKEEVLGVDSTLCWDKIIDISSTGNDITILVRRNKSKDPKLESNPLNIDFKYEIKAVFENGRFTYLPVNTDSIVQRGPWPKPKIQLPPGPYTPAEMEMYYDRYGQEAVDEALLIKELYG